MAMKQPDPKVAMPKGAAKGAKVDMKKGMTKMSMKGGMKKMPMKKGM